MGSRRLRETKAVPAPNPIGVQYVGPLRDAQGRLPRGCPWNYHWYLGQGELYWPLNDRSTGFVHYAIALLELNNGAWIARPEWAQRHTWTVNAHLYQSREQALRVAVASVIRQAREAARRYRRGGDSLFELSGTSLAPATAERIVRWALDLLGRDAPSRIFIACPAEPAREPQARVERLMQGSLFY